MKTNFINYVVLLTICGSMMGCGDDAKDEVTPEIPVIEVVEPVKIPSIDTFSPLHGIAGEAVTLEIKGSAFSQTDKFYLVDAAGATTALSATSVEEGLVTVTATVATTGTYELVLKSGEHEKKALDKFSAHTKATLDPIVGSSLADHSYSTAIGSYVMITGTNLSAFEAGNKVYLVDAAGKETEMRVLVSKFDRVGFVIADATVLGNYKVKIVTEFQAVVYPGTLIVVEAAPYIASVSPATVVAGGQITISGKYFSTVAEENIVSLSVSTSNGAAPVRLTMVSASATELVVATSSELAEGDYTLSVSKNGKTSYYNNEVIKVTLPPVVPVIESLNKTIFARGETIIITGKNLKKQFTATNINLIPYPMGGATTVRSIVVNDAGTEASFTIPADFRIGKYELSVEVDFDYSEIKIIDIQ